MIRLRHALVADRAELVALISPDPEPEKGAFYCSDHISLAKVGVPMLDPGGGYDYQLGQSLLSARR